MKHHLDLLFAKAIDISYEQAAIVAGNPLDFVDHTYHHHIYASASYYLMLWEGAGSFDLDGWESRIFRALNLDYRQQIKGLPDPITIKNPITIGRAIKMKETVHIRVLSIEMMVVEFCSLSFQ